MYSKSRKRENGRRSRGRRCTKGQSKATCLRAEVR